MTFTMMATHDVFVARPAALDTLQRTLQHYLQCAPFEGNMQGASATVGQHALLYVGGHGFSDAMVTFPTGRPAKLSSDFPIWVSIRGFRDEFEQEATARRVFQVIANQQWPAVLLHDLRTMLAHAHCDGFTTTPVNPPIASGAPAQPPAS